MYRLGKQRAQGDQAQGSSQQQQLLGTTSALPFPTEGIIKDTGEQVMFLQTCDWIGHSPSLVRVDKDGEFLIASFEESRATDPRVLPNLQAQELRNRRT